MDNKDSAERGFMNNSKPDMAELALAHAREHFNYSPTRMQERKTKGVDTTVKNRNLKRTVALGAAGTLFVASGLGLGASEVGLVGGNNQAEASAPEAREVLDTGLPSANLPIIHEKISQVDGVRSDDAPSSVSVAEKTKLDSEKIEAQKNMDDGISELDIQNAIKAAPEKYRKDAQVAIPLIAQALKDRGINSEAVFAYALATVEHESYFKAMEEIDGEEQALKYNYPGGIKYFGRGYVMTTGEPNYIETGKDIGEDLDNNPELLLEPEIAAKALVSHFIKKGTVGYAQKLDFVHARKTINGAEFGMDEEPFKSTPWNIAQRAFDYLSNM